MFLSKKAVNAFGGYANSQLRRLDNKAVRLVEQEKRETHILNSINNAKYTFSDKYFYYPEDSINLYIDKLDFFLAKRLFFFNLANRCCVAHTAHVVDKSLFC